MNWDYKDYPNSDVVLETQTNQVLRQIHSGALVSPRQIADTRWLHRSFFHVLTPMGHEYFAGNYRGENFFYLKNYNVTVSGNSKVGCPAQHVPTVMHRYTSTVELGITALDDIHRAAAFSLGERLRRTVDFACATFIKLNQIHPYANGNGHMSRFTLVATLKRYGYNIRAFPIDPRPLDPPYTALIRLYEKGQKEPLIQYVSKLLEIS